MFDESFDRFWREYPRRASKLDAQKAWRKLAPSPELVEKIIAALRWQKNTAQWTKNGRSFVPYAATWLRGERWDDEPFETRPMLTLQHPWDCPHEPRCPHRAACAIVSARTA